MTARRFVFEEPEAVAETEILVRVRRIRRIDIRNRTFVATAEDGTGLLQLEGTGDAVLPGEQARARGVWTARAGIDRLFRATTIEETATRSAEGALVALEAPAWGVARSVARRLHERFGDALPEALGDARRLVDAGLAPDRARVVADRWTRRRRHGRTICALSAIGVPANRIETILQRYGDDAARMVFQQPYRLAEDVPGFGFESAERLAMLAGIGRGERDRLRAGLRDAIAEQTARGHCCVPETPLVLRAADRLAVRLDQVQAEVERMHGDGAFILEERAGLKMLWSPGMHACEGEVARDVADRIGAVEPGVDVDRLVAETEEATGVRLHEGQQAAVKAALRNRLVIITGGPGTGKTATMRVLIESVRRARPDIRVALAAPTGRAAKRLTESTGIEARTVHRTLGWDAGKRDFMHDQRNPLPADLVVVDEASMLGIWLTRDLLRALDRRTTLVLVGDADQLPSVEAGNVLHDLIDTGLIPTTRLTKVWRQAEGSSIGIAARRVIRGSAPEAGPPGSPGDVWWSRIPGPEEAGEAVLELVTRRLPALGFDPVRDVQVVAAGHDHASGTKALNRLLQDALNPARPGTLFVALPGRDLRVGDKVMQSTNNYDLEVFNGDLGMVTAIVQPDEEMPGLARGVEVDIDGRTVVYTGMQMEELQLAYATTVHKSQGSEYPVAVVVITRAHPGLLQRNLLYTAITRARRHCCLVMDERGMKKSLEGVDSMRRHTALADRIRDHRSIDLGSGP